VDGASRWQQFRSVTLPSLKPALVPAIILSVVWTFNMFNIIYLVSAGEPAGATEILITEAYKIAFEQYRYGYAAAYSTVIFMILLIYGIWQNRVTRATEGI
jgi:arabinogalactan oligomer/maltooligosaccharide transport system permease protein